MTFRFLQQATSAYR